MLQRRCDLVLVIKAEQTEVLSITADIEIEIVDKRLFRQTAIFSDSDSICSSAKPRYKFLIYKCSL